MSPVPILGYCPACGQSKLFVPDTGGAVLCHHHGCPEPTAAHGILGDHETQHVAVVREKDFTLRHPLIERLDDRLLECRVHQMLVDLGAKLEPGVYRVTMFV